MTIFLIKWFVLVDNELVSQIGKGLCVLIGISRNDKTEDSDYMSVNNILFKLFFYFKLIFKQFCFDWSVRKILNLRLFESEDGKRWNNSVIDRNYEILSVSQFTLYSTLKGNKPDFHNAMEATKSQLFYNEFLQKLKNSYKSQLIKGISSYLYWSQLFEI